MRSRWLAKSLCKSFLVFSCCVAVDPFLLWADEGNCAHAALRHSLMREHNKVFDSQAVISQFPREHRDKTPVPIYVLSDVAYKMGLRFDVVKLDPHKPTAEWESAILFLFPKSANGHFVMCKDVEADRVVIVDSDSVPVEKRISTRQLAALWDGTALIVSRRSRLQVLESIVLSIIFATAIVVFLSWLRRKRAIVKIALLATLPYLQGCDAKHSPPSPRPIYFENDVIVLERQVEQGKTLVVPLTLKTSPTASQTLIKSVSTNCGCLRVSADELQGHVLGPGGVCTINVEVLPENREVVGGEQVIEEHLWKYQIDPAATESGMVSFDYPNPIKVEFAF